MPVRPGYPSGMPCWVDCITGDPAASRTFYGELFDWTFDDHDHDHDHDGGGEGGGYAIARRDGRVVGGLGAAPPGYGPGASWTTYLASKDLDRTVTDLRRAGGRVVLPPLQAGADGRLLLALDPSQAAVGFWQGDRPEGVVLTGEHGAMTWHELSTPSAAVLAFYRRLFDLTATAGGASVLVTLDDRPGFAVRESVGAPRWVPYFGSRSVAQTVRHAVELGAVELGAVELGAVERGAVVLSDPGGAVFGVTAVPG